MDFDNLLSVPAVAVRLGISEDRVRKLVAVGGLPNQGRGLHELIPESAVRLVEADLRTLADAHA